MEKSKTLTVVRKILFAILFLILITAAILPSMLAKFASGDNSDEGARVLAFNPSVSYGNAWEESVMLTSSGQGSDMPFVISTEQTETDVKITLTLVSDSTIPYDFELYLEDERFYPEYVTENTYIFSGVMPSGLRANLRLVSKWGAEEYDERFNKLTNDVKVTLRCEQIGEA